jgi:hypothetical protein
MSTCQGFLWKLLRASCVLFLLLLPPPPHPPPQLHENNVLVINIVRLCSTESAHLLYATDMSMLDIRDMALRSSLCRATSSSAAAFSADARAASTAAACDDRSSSISERIADSVAALSLPWLVRTDSLELSSVRHQPSVTLQVFSIYVHNVIDDRQPGH